MKPVCLITGAGGRLGQDLCSLLQEDFNLIATYHHTAPDIPSTVFATETEPAEPLPDNANTHCLIQADLNKRGDIQNIIDIGMNHFGRIDAVINAAADIKFHGHLRDLWQADDYPISQLQLNSVIPIQLASAIYQNCWKKSSADNAYWNRCVINVSSISGLYVFEERGQAFYGVSKAAMNMLTLYLSLELAPENVRVNAICPSQFKGKSATRRVSEAIKQLLTGNQTGEIIT